LAALGIKTVIDLQHDGPANEPSLVRAAGQSAGLCALCWRPSPNRRDDGGVSNDQWTPDQAFKEMKRYQFDADFLHPEFNQFVFAYQPTMIDPAPQIVVAREATESQVR
jgi:hypothetical protein